MNQHVTIPMWGTGKVVDIKRGYVCIRHQWYPMVLWRKAEDIGVEYLTRSITLTLADYHAEQLGFAA